MEERNNNKARPINPRRRRRSRFQIFKEAYLPIILVCVVLALIVVFIVSSVSRSNEYQQEEAQKNDNASIALQQELDRLNKEANALMAEAAPFAKDYDYDSAIAVLERFSGDMSKFEKLSQLHQSYVDAKNNLVLWEDNSKIPNLSFQLLIADPERAFSDSTYGTAYNRNFVTTAEFSKILQQLYENGYMLVSLDDIFAIETNDVGAAHFEAKPLYLPKGKKPILITQTNVNYNTYMIDGDGDKLADKDGAGFASRLLLDEDGNLTCEIVNADGSVTTGAYDLVPILDAFIASHPDFSYRGAKAILAVTGYDGLFGYRTTPAADEYFGKIYRDQQIAEVTEVIAALRNSGYEIACYTYENIPYGDYSNATITEDLTKWNDEVVPILGNIDILVYAWNSDISNTGTQYSGEKFSILNSYGFRYYLGFCQDGTPWQTVTDTYIRQGRLLVTGSNMAHHGQWFSGIFDPSTVLDGSRGNIPT